MTDRSAPSAARHAPSAERNRAPLADVLATVLPDAGLVLTVAEGTGQQVAWFADRFPALSWQPSDPDEESRASIAAHTTGLANVRPPIDLDTTLTDWGIDTADAIVCSNMIHIAPWQVTEGLLAGAGRLLTPDGVLVTYGPYKVDGQHTAETNAAFDASLRQRNPAWGIRDVGEIEELGKAQGLGLEQRLPMPANNFSLIFRAGPPGGGAR